MGIIGEGTLALSPEASLRLNQELQPGEQVVWTGQPLPALASRGTMMFSVIGGVMLIPGIIGIGVIGGIMLLFILLTRAYCFGLFLLPVAFVALVGVTLAIALPLWTRRLARQTFYVLTDRRAIVWRKMMFGFQVQSFTGAQLSQLQRFERSDGTGDLIFQQRYFAGSHGESHRSDVGFTAIANVRHVETMVRNTLLPAPPNIPVPPVQKSS